MYIYIAEEELVFLASAAMIVILTAQASKY